MLTKQKLELDSLSFYSKIMIFWFCCIAFQNALLKYSIDWREIFRGKKIWILDC